MTTILVFLEVIFLELLIASDNMIVYLKDLLNVRKCSDSILVLLFSEKLLAFKMHTNLNNF